MDTRDGAAQRYARCIAASRRVRWDIDHDVIRGRDLDFGRKFLPDGLSRVNELAFLRPGEARLLSQVQGRTYANMIGLLERFIGALTHRIGQDHWIDNPVAMEAMARFTVEELKHRVLFGRLEALAAAGLPPGYAFGPRPDGVATSVLARSRWAVLGFTLDIEIFTLAHYRSSIEMDESLSALWKDVFLFHWKEESQHAILDELEWRREDERLDAPARERAVDELIALVADLDGMLRAQAAADAGYFLRAAGRPFAPGEQAAVHDLVLKAYRWQYIASGVEEPRFVEVLKSLVTPAQMARFAGAIEPIVAHADG